MSIPVLPESAPFSSEQRAWLNGFFAGLASGNAPEAASAAAATPMAMVTPPIEDESFLWHDPAMPMGERLKLADGKPSAERLQPSLTEAAMVRRGEVNAPVVKGMNRDRRLLRRHSFPGLAS